MEKEEGSSYELRTELTLRRGLSKTQIIHKERLHLEKKVLLPGYGLYGWIAPWSLITKIRFLGSIPKSGWSYANLKILILMKKCLSEGTKKTFLL